MRPVASSRFGVLGACAVALPLLVSAAPRPAAGDGSLTPLEGKAGCVAAEGGTKGLRALRAGCSRARALRGLRRVAVSPGGGSVYATAAGSDALAVFRRSSRGTLRQLEGRAACVSVAAGDGCARARALRDPYDVVVSPDGRSVYAGSWSSRAIVAFARNRRTGALRQLEGRDGCIGGRRADRCRAARGLGTGVISLQPSSDGRFLYAGTSAGVAAFRRDARTGRLDQLDGPRGCVTGVPVEGCARGRSLAAANDIALDRGRESLYAAAGSVAAFRLAGGAPRQLAGAAGCIGDAGDPACTPGRSLNGPFGLAVSPDGAQVYASVEFSAAVAILTRDRRTGALTQQPGPLGCIRDGGALDCADARHLEHPGQIELSSDGRNAYVVGRGILVVLRRDRGSGALSQLPGRKGCLNSLSRPGARRPDCADSGRVNPLGVALSRDGRNAYVTDTETDVIAAYRRAR